MHTRDETRRDERERENTFVCSILPSSSAGSGGSGEEPSSARPWAAGIAAPLKKNSSLLLPLSFYSLPLPALSLSLSAIYLNIYLYISFPRPVCTVCYSLNLNTTLSCHDYPALLLLSHSPLFLLPEQQSDRLERLREDGRCSWEDFVCALSARVRTLLLQSSSSYSSSACPLSLSLFLPHTILSLSLSLSLCVSLSALLTPHNPLSLFPRMSTNPSHPLSPNPIWT